MQIWKLVCLWDISDKLLKSAHSANLEGGFGVRSGSITCFYSRKGNVIVLRKNRWRHKFAKGQAGCTEAAWVHNCAGYALKMGKTSQLRQQSYKLARAINQNAARDFLNVIYYEQISLQNEVSRLDPSPCPPGNVTSWCFSSPFRNGNQDERNNMKK